MWAPVAGKYGKTRDGRKVGPMEHNDAEGYPWRIPTGSDPDHRYINWRADGSNAVFGSRLDLAGPEFDLVAEWVDDVGPVRQRTVWEIVPGVHDHVTVETVQKDPHGPRVGVGIGARNQYALMNADELEAAAHVLTQLAEALRHG